MAAPHAIHEEFPQEGERIHALKVSNAHFARLLEEYDQVNDEVAGAESRQQIGMVIVGGLLVGTFFTLFVVPVMYLLLVRHAPPPPRMETAPPPLPEA